MDKNFILDLTVNTTDPKNNKEFLWLSYSMNHLRPIKYEKSKDVYLYSGKTDMTFRPEHGSVLFPLIYIAGKD